MLLKEHASKLESSPATRECFKPVFYLSRLPMWPRNRKTAFGGLDLATQAQGRLAEGCGDVLPKALLCISPWLWKSGSPSCVLVVVSMGASLWGSLTQSSPALHSDGLNCPALATLFTPQRPLISLCMKAAFLEKAVAGFPKAKMTKPE